MDSEAKSRGGQCACLGQPPSMFPTLIPVVGATRARAGMSRQVGQMANRVLQQEQLEQRMLRRQAALVTVEKRCLKPSDDGCSELRLALHEFELRVQPRYVVILAARRRPGEVDDDDLVAVHQHVAGSDIGVDGDLAEIVTVDLAASSVEVSEHAGAP